MHCTMNDCGKPYRLIDHGEGTGYCDIHGTRYLVTHQPLPRPIDDREKRYKNNCVDCGRGIKNSSTRCNPCNHELARKKPKTGDSKRFRAHAWQMGSLASRPHDWVMPV